MATVEAMLMITPPDGDCASICFTPSRAQRKTPRALTLITRSQSCKLVSRIVPTWLIPALLTRISSRPSVAATCFSAALTWDSSATSSCCTRALPSAARIPLATRSAASASMSARMTCAPCCAKSRAICSPSPILPLSRKHFFYLNETLLYPFFLRYISHAKRSVCVKHFLHSRPPFAGRTRLQGNLHWIGQGPPFAGFGVGSHLCHIGLVIVADIFKICKEQFAMTKNAVVADVACGNRRQHFGPHSGMQAFIRLDLVCFQAYNLPNSAHSSFLSFRPRRAIGIGIAGNRRGVHSHAIPWSFGWHITAVLDDNRMHKMLVQVRCVLDHAIFQRAAYRDVVEEREMLHILAQADASRVRADRNTRAGSHQEDSQDFIDSADATGVNLANSNGIGLKELLEDDTVLHVLAGGNMDRRDCAGNCSVPKNIVRAGGFFNPERVKGRQVLHSGNRFVYLPHLVCIEHQCTLWPYLFAHDARAAYIIFQA